MQLTSLKNRQEAALRGSDELVAVQRVVVEALQPESVLIDDVNFDRLKSVVFNASKQT